MFPLPRRFLALCVPNLLALVLPFLPAATARISCASDAECERTYRLSTSRCVEGLCSNPFEGGCLRAVLGGKEGEGGEKSDGGGDEGGAKMSSSSSGLLPSLRACNSDDPPHAADLGLCVRSAFDYPEIRVLNQNWQSTTFLAWTMQIVLSEVANVPVTIETGDRTDRRASFYDPELRWDYATTSYDYDALRRANAGARSGNSAGGSCAGTEEPCAHVMPELWSGQRKNWDDARREGVVEPAEGNGQFGKYDWTVPRWVAEEDPTLLSFYGLRGEENRRKLADRFKRPTNWRDYCEEMSETKCEPGSGDEFAVRPPENDEEGNSYFVEDAFRGYFRATDKNDCDADPAGCTGHFVDRSCDSSTFFVQQARWLGIALESDGPLPGGGYSSPHLNQIWMAADATNSSVMALFARPNPFVQEYERTESAFQSIVLPRSNAECVAKRVSQEERCSADPTARVGRPEGSCDSEHAALMRLIVSSLYETTQEETEAERSPAYDVVKNLKVPTIEMEDIFGRWIAGTVDKREFDARMAVCGWVADNIDDLRALLPNTYPRQLKEESFYDLPLLYVSLATGGIAILSLAACAALTYKWRAKKVMVYAQPTFLFMIVAGLLLVAAASILYAVPPSSGACVARQWLVTMGYSLELVPLLVKISAINRLVQQSKKMRRVKIGQNVLYTRVGCILLAVCVYLSVWTAVDPPSRQSEMALTDETTLDGAIYVVETEYFCASSSKYWSLVSQFYLLALLLSASVLATQSRNIRQEFNESRFLAGMVYFHFLFVVLRLLLFLLGDKLGNRAAVSGAVSLLLSSDVLIAAAVYFAPKLYKANRTEENYESGRFSGVSGAGSSRLNSTSSRTERFRNEPSFGNIARDSHPREGNADEDTGTGISEADKAKMERRVSWSSDPWSDNA